MSIDTWSESEISSGINVAEVVGELRSVHSGKTLDRGTVSRWIRTGVVLRGTGERYRLRAKKLPGGWITTRQALNEFIRVITEDRLGPGDGATRDEATTRYAIALTSKPQKAAAAARSRS